MKKFSVIIAVVFAVSLIMTACGREPITGSTKIEKGSTAKKRKVTFSFFLNKKGLQAVAAIIAKEISNAEKNKNVEKAKNLTTLKEKFTAKNFANALSIIKNVSVAGTFNGWKAGKDSLESIKQDKTTIYTVTKEWEFATANPPYKFVFRLNLTKKALNMQTVWVPDPMALNTVGDGFGGKNAVLKIKDFPAAKK